MARRRGVALAETVPRYTNLHRRLGFGRRGNGPSPPAWQHYLDRLTALSDHEQRVTWTVECHRRAASEASPPDRIDFGAFGCNPPDDRGVVRIHFNPKDGDGSSPLAPEKIPRRTAELHAMLHDVRRNYPTARSIRGTSWLYHLHAYRRLFPVAYVATRTLHGASLRYEGNANWGQFLTHGGRVKAGPRARMLENLKHLDPRRPWLAFPLPALTPQAPVAVFYDYYGVR
ncbi:MAG: hypothetical protein ACODAC_07890 [Pseudomonadota bacterium]